MTCPSSGKQDSIRQHLSSSQASSIPVITATAPPFLLASSSSLPPPRASSDSDSKVKAEGRQSQRPRMTTRRGGYSVGSTVGRSALGTRYRKSHDNPLRDRSASTTAVPYFEILDDSSSDDGDDLLSNFLGAGFAKNTTGYGGLKGNTTQIAIPPSGDAAAHAENPAKSSTCSPKYGAEDTLKSFLKFDGINSGVEQVGSASEVSAAEQSYTKKKDSSASAGVPANAHNNTARHASSYDSADDGSSSDPLTGDIPPFASTPRMQSTQFPIPKSTHKSTSQVRNHTASTPATSREKSVAVHMPQKQFSSISLTIPAQKTSRPAPAKSSTPSHTVLPQLPSGSSSQSRHKSVAKPPQNGVPPQLDTTALQSPLLHRTKPTQSSSTAAKVTAKAPTKLQTTSSRATTMSTASVMPTAPLASRRPRRNVAQPMNYFAPQPDYDGHVDADEGYQQDPIINQPECEASPPRRTRKVPAEVQRASLPPNKVAPKRQIYPILYQSSTVHARQEPLNYESAQRYLRLTRTKGIRRPYIGYQMRMNINQLCSTLDASEMERNEGEVVHCDFELDEIRAVYAIMVEKDDLSPEVQEPAGLLHHLQQRMKAGFSTDNKLEELARRLTLLNSLRKSLTKAKTSLVECRNSSMDGSLTVCVRKTILELLQRLGLIAIHADPKLGLQSLLGAANLRAFERICFLYPLTKALKYRNKMTFLKAFLLDARDSTISRVPSLIRALPNPNLSTHLLPLLSDPPY
ncbi:hypothetical protein KEM54_004997 [Ascosphaera aggregata]|nr:hypothetical protein KEM54_004997 [Ascosphaera aggregata]